MHIIRETYEENDLVRHRGFKGFSGDHNDTTRQKVFKLFGGDKKFQKTVLYYSLPIASCYMKLQSKNTIDCLGI
jgi:hypothetical protein